MDQGGSFRGNFKHTQNSMKIKIQHPVRCNKSMVKGKFIALYAYMRNKKKPQINNKNTRKRRANKPKASKRKKMINIRAKINKIENREKPIK